MVCGTALMRVAAVSVCFAMPSGVVGALAQEVELPRFDVEVYCKQVSEFSGGSEQIYGFCFDEEQKAYNELKPTWGALPAKIRKHCSDVARFAGDSYQLLGFCVDEEQKSADSNANKSFKF